MIGTQFQAAYWFSTPDEKLHAEIMIQQFMVAVEKDNRVLLDRIVWSELNPDVDECPEPEDPQWPRETRLLMGRATVVAVNAARGANTGFVDGLSGDDLKTLRTITRTQFKTNTGVVLTDDECDEIIDRQGPKTVLESMH